MYRRNTNTIAGSLFGLVLLTFMLAVAILELRRVRRWLTSSLRGRKSLTLFVGMERSRLKMAQMSCLLGSAMILYTRVRSQDGEKLIGKVIMLNSIRSDTYIAGGGKQPRSPVIGWKWHVAVLFCNALWVMEFVRQICDSRVKLH